MVKRRKFSRDFKIKILEELKIRSLVEVCREYDLLPSVVSRWKREKETYPTNAFQGKGTLYKAEAKIAQYERLIGRLYAEIETLKKSHQMILEREKERKMCSK